MLHFIHHAVLQETDTMVSQADLEFLAIMQYWLVVKAIKFIKIKTRFSLEHVINGPLGISSL